MRKFLAGVGALIVLGAVLVGVPLALVTLVGDPLPTAEQWQRILSLTPDYGNEIMVTKLLPCLAWAAWAVFAGPFLVEIVARIAGRPTRKRSWAFGGQQRMAAALIAAVLAMGAGAAGLAASSPDSAPTASPQLSSSQTLTVEEAPAQQPIAPPAAVAPASAPQQAQAAEHTVEQGESLWSIAEQHYGDGSRYGEIAEASADVVQDPDLIQPGWQLQVPGAAAAEQPVEVEQPGPAPAPEPAVETAPEAAPAPVEEQAPTAAPQAAPEAQTPAPAAEVAPEPASAPVEAPAGTPEQPGDAAESGASVSFVDADADSAADEAADLDDAEVPLTTAGGIGGLLAAGLLTGLARRRLRQRRDRAPGTRIAMPDARAEVQELELRMVETPLMVADLDRALRTLQSWAERTGAALPPLFAVRIDGAEIALYLAEPAELPAPFERTQPDGTAWRVLQGAPLDPPRSAASPYPALVTLGTDARGGRLLFDLERIRSLGFEGDGAIARGMLNGMATELALLPWADQLQLTLVNLPLRLPRRINPYRVQQVDDLPALLRNLRADLERRERAIASHGADDVRSARAHAAGEEAWAPHVILLGEVPDAAAQRELAELIEQHPRLGVASVARDAAPGVASAKIRVASAEAAELLSAGGELPPLPFVPQLLAGEELELVEELFEASYRPAVAAPPPPPPLPPTAPQRFELTPEQFRPAPIAPEATDAHDAATEPMTRPMGARPPGGSAWAPAETTTAEGWTPPDLLARDAPTALPERPEPHRPAAAPAAPASDREPDERTLAAGRADEPDPLERTLAAHAPRDEAEHALPLDEATVRAVRPGPSELATVTAPVPVQPAASAAQRPASARTPAEAPAWPAPYVRLLGPVDALHLADAEAMPARGVELLAHLVLHRPAAAGALRRALWGDTPEAVERQRSLVRRTRLALGHAPDGEPLLPEAAKGVGYELHYTVRSDWHDFRMLLGADLEAASDDDLLAALRLVRGVPFAGSEGKQWWQWVASQQEEMIAAVTDAADELSRRALGAADDESARFAGRIAQLIDPLNESGWRAEASAALLVGDAEGFRRSIAELSARLAEAGIEDEFEEATQRVVAEGARRFGGR